MKLTRDQKEILNNAIKERIEAITNGSEQIILDELEELEAMYHSL